MRRNSAFEFRAIFLMSLLGCGLVSSGFAQGPGLAPRPPREEQASIRLADPRLGISLAAAEPLVNSPVAIAWDADGFLFVAEMIDYPVAPAAGRIRRLEDHDGDGVYDRATVFAEGLPFPNGVLPCFGGVLVTAAPDIWFLRDTDGDGRADERRIVLTGFIEGNTQLRVNGLFWGLDNWIHAANGRSDGMVRSPDQPPGQAVAIRRRDLRFQFRPDEKPVSVQAIAGFSQFGLGHDDWGNRFPSWNTVPVRHVVLEQEVLDRNPYLAETSSVADILDPADGGRVHGISPAQSRFNRESIAYFNATCGTTVYRGDLLPSEYRGNVFACESLINLVHRRVLEPAGPTFVARRAEKDQEFLASTDNAFRAVNLATGPDGALYLVDMYREMVEHPDFVPGELRTKVDFRRWHDRGRIWRIAPSTESLASNRPARRPSLSKANVEDLVKQLSDPNGWWRDTAQRLLVERQDRRAGPFLTDLLQTAKSPETRLHALWTLAGLGLLDAAILERAAHDPHPAVREHALRAARAGGLSKAITAGTLSGLAGDSSIRVRLQSAILLGDRGREDRQLIQELARLALRDVADPWMRLAILSGLAETALPFLQDLLALEPRLLESPSSDQARLLADLAAIVGVRRREDELAAFLNLLAGKRDRTSTDAGRLALLLGLGEGLERSGPPLHVWLARPSERIKSRVERLGPLWKAARGLAVSDQAAERRRLGFESLVRGQPEQAAAIVPELIKSSQPRALQSSAARGLARIGRPEPARLVLESWDELALSTRRELLAALVSTRALAEVLVQALERQIVAPVELDPASREALARLADAGLRARAAAILARSAPADRSTVVKRYQPSLTLTGDPARGLGLFARNCQTCHQHQGQGHRVGPDLSGIAGRPAAVLLSDVLDPNRDVAPDFIALTVATHGGQVVSGLLAEETTTSLKLRRAEGVEETLLRSEIAEVRSSGRSLMPEGLEQALSLQEMADLLAFLRQGNPTGK